TNTTPGHGSASGVSATLHPLRPQRSWKPGVGVKDSSFLGLSLPDHAKNDFSLLVVKSSKFRANGLSLSRVPSTSSCTSLPIHLNVEVLKLDNPPSWNKDSASFKNQLSEEASDPEKARKLWVGSRGSSFLGSLRDHPSRER
ncbi:hypothetical protein Taro_005397, partial [Colocasia esculenta]|nr:hypothetical protein [Colocasia esculenta]